MSNSEVEKDVVEIFTHKATKFAQEITSIFEDYKSISDEKFDDTFNKLFKHMKLKEKKP